MAFDPTQLSGLQLWLDATATTTLTTSATDAPPALGNIADGASIGTWFDNSGNGNHFSQTTTGEDQPTYSASGGQIGGHPCAIFPCSTLNGNGPFLTERVANLYNVLGGSNTVLILCYKYNTAEQVFEVLFTNSTGGNGTEFLIRYNGCFERFQAGSTAAMSEAAAHALTYSFNSTNNKETFYVDSAAAPAFSTTAGRPAIPTSACQISDFNDPLNGEVYEIVVYNRELSNSEIAEVYAYWNTKYGTSFNASAGPLTASTLSATTVTKTSQTLAASSPSGGTSPYSYQWYRSTVSGSASSVAVSGNAVAGATGLSFSDSGLTPQTTYYYVLKVIDSASSSATVLSTVLTAPTHGNITVNIGFIGDSITDGANSSTDPVTQFALAMQAEYPQLDVQAFNYGHSGEVFRVYSRLMHAGGTNGGGGVTSLVTTLQGAGITYLGIMEGTNDWSYGPYGPNSPTDPTYTPANYLADVEDVASALTTAGITVYINQLIYRTSAGADDPTTGLPAWNAELA
jgi:hypothetical protein